MYSKIQDRFDKTFIQYALANKDNMQAFTPKQQYNIQKSRGGIPKQPLVTIPFPGPDIKLFDTPVSFKTWQQMAPSIPNGDGNVQQQIYNRVAYLMDTPTETWTLYNGDGTTTEMPFKSDISCNATVTRVSNDLDLEGVNYVFRWDGTGTHPTGNTFWNIEDKKQWFENNPDKGLFLGGYIFNGYQQLQQLDSTGVPQYDNSNGFGLSVIQEYLDNGHVVISWTPNYNALPADLQDDVGRVVALDEGGKPFRDNFGNIVYNGYDHAHIAFVFDSNANNYMQRGPYLAQGGLGPDHWDTRYQNGSITLGLYDQHWTTGYTDSKKRPFYIFVLYQGEE